MCGCGLEIESTQQFLRCHFYQVERLELLNNPYDIHLSVNELNEDSTINLVSYGSDKYHKGKIRKMLLNCIAYHKDTKR